MHNLEFASYMYPIECKGNSNLVEPENKKKLYEIVLKMVVNNYIIIMYYNFLKTQCTDIEYVDIAYMFTE